MFTVYKFDLNICFLNFINMKSITFFFSLIRLIPHCLIFRFNKNNDIILYEVNRWLDITKTKKSFGFIRLMTNFPEFRNLFYFRIGKWAKLIRFLCPQMNTLLIGTKNIGPGLFIQHGLATVIVAKSIGRDCWINQQVTIGYSNEYDCPTIGDNVVINAGAKIIGGITMGNNSIAGANAVVVKNVPENCTVVGVPAYIVKRNGLRVNEKL